MPATKQSRDKQKDMHVDKHLDTFTFMELLFFALTVASFVLLWLSPTPAGGLIFATTVFAIVTMVQGFAQLQRHHWISLIFIVISFSILAATMRSL